MATMLCGPVHCVLLCLSVIGSDRSNFSRCAHALVGNEYKSSYISNRLISLVFASYLVCGCMCLKVWERSLRDRFTGLIFVDNGDTLPPGFNFHQRNVEEVDVIFEDPCGRSVLKARWNGRDVAVKKFTARSSSLSVLLMAREANRLLRLRHPNVLHLFGYYFEAMRDVIEKSSMVMELMECDLQDYIAAERRGEGLPFRDGGLYIMAQIANGMNHVHMMGYCHRDLKPQNVLVRRTGDPHRPEVKIADFGSSEVMAEMHFDRNAGTLLYKAPELLTSSFSIFYNLRQWVHRLVYCTLLRRSNLTMSSKTDVYSFGVLCCKLLKGVEPYSDQGIKTARELRQHISSGNTPTIPTENVPPEIQALIRNCLARNPIDRPDFRQICRTLDRTMEGMRGAEFVHLAVDTVPGAGRPDGAVEGDIERDSEALRRVNRIRDMGYPERYFIRDEETIRVGEKLGQGTDAIVYKVEWNGCQYAGRVPVRVLDDARDEEKAQIQRALEFEREQVVRLPTLQHPNLLLFFGYSWLEPRNRVICLMELMQMDLGQLTLMRSRGEDWTRARGFTRPYDDERARYIMKEIAAGMEYLHAKGVIHGDLHCSNILIFSHREDCCREESSCSPPFRGHSGCLEGMTVKIADCGSDPKRCAYDYAAPELLEMLKRNGFEESDWLSKTSQEKSQFFKSCDVYSYAVLSSQILSGNFPLDTVVRMTCRDRGTICQGVRPTLPEDADEDLKVLIQRCWDKNPISRPGFAEIHEILSTNRPSAIRQQPRRLQRFLKLIWPQYRTCQMLCSLVVVGVLCALTTPYISSDGHCPASCKQRVAPVTSIPGEIQ